MAATGFLKVAYYHAQRDVPCLVFKAYDTNGAATTVEGNIVTGDLILLGEGQTQLLAVTKGTAAGQFEFGN